MSTDPNRDPRPDELYCVNCGEIYREDEQQCPHCGYLNPRQADDEEAAAAGGAGGGAGAQDATGAAAQDAGGAGGTAAGGADGQNAGATGGGGTDGGRRDDAGASGRTAGQVGEPTRVTDRDDIWFYGVLVGLGLWLVGLMLASSGEDFAALAALTMLLGWVVLPLATYLDIRFVRTRSDWDPDALYYTVLMVIPVLNLLAGAGYLYSRWEANVG